MQNELVTSLSEAFPKNDIIAQCENKLIEVHRLLDQTLVQTENVKEVRTWILKLSFGMNHLISNNYLFEIDSVTQKPKEKFPK